MTPEERTEWVLWSVRNDPDIDGPSGQEAIARSYICKAIRAAEDAAQAALKAELESCRTSLTTAEKEREKTSALAVQLQEALRRALSQGKRPACSRCGRPVALICTEVFPSGVTPCSPREGEGEFWLECVALCLTDLPASSRSNAGNVPKAPPDSDSSALEKALGALRARDAEWRKALELSHYDSIDGVHIDHTYPDGHHVKCDECAPLRALLSGGAHVDGPKAKKEESK